VHECEDDKLEDQMNVSPLLQSSDGTAERNLDPVEVERKGISQDTKMGLIQSLLTLSMTGLSPRVAFAVRSIFSVWPIRSMSHTRVPKSDIHMPLQKSTGATISTIKTGNLKPSDSALTARMAHLSNLSAHGHGRGASRALQGGEGAG